MEPVLIDILEITSANGQVAYGAFRNNIILIAETVVLFVPDNHIFTADFFLTIGAYGITLRE
jgi:hypothetical protein